jgi:hypothetical protein
MYTISNGNRISYRVSATSLLALFTFGLGLSAKTQDHKPTIITFDAPGATPAPFFGTQPDAINPAGVITGYYFDASVVGHGFLRDAGGTITTFDVPGAGTGNFQGTFALSINPAGAIAGQYKDAGNVYHGFLRAPDGALTTFEVQARALARTRAPIRQALKVSTRRERSRVATLTMPMYSTFLCALPTAHSSSSTFRVRAPGQVRARLSEASTPPG